MARNGLTAFAIDAIINVLVKNSPCNLQMTAVVAYPTVGFLLITLTFATKKTLAPNSKRTAHNLKRTLAFRITF